MELLFCFLFQMKNSKDPQISTIPKAITFMLLNPPMPFFVTLACCGGGGGGGGATAGGGGGGGGSTTGGCTVPAAT